MQNNNYRVKGAFFENDRGTGPAFTGFVEIDGQRTEIALWPKTSAKGTNYFQVSEDRKKKPPQQGSFAPMNAPRQYTQPTTGRAPSRSPPLNPAPQHGYGGHPQNDMDDDIPFNIEWR